MRFAIPVALSNIDHYGYKSKEHEEVEQALADTSPVSRPGQWISKDSLVAVGKGKHQVFLADQSAVRLIEISLAEVPWPLQDAIRASWSQVHHIPS